MRIWRRAMRSNLRARHILMGGQILVLFVVFMVVGVISLLQGQDASGFFIIGALEGVLAVLVIISVIFSQRKR